MIRDRATITRQEGPTYLKSTLEQVVQLCPEALALRRCHRCRCSSCFNVCVSWCCASKNKVVSAVQLGVEAAGLVLAHATKQPARWPERANKSRVAVDSFLCYSRSMTTANLAQHMCNEEYVAAAQLQKQEWKRALQLWRCRTQRTK
jgi:hypothetical protein